MSSDERDEINLMGVFGALKKWWWIVVGVAVFSTCISIVVNKYFTQNVYEASTSLYSGTLSKGSISSLLQELQVGENVIQDYREIVKSRLIVEETKRLLIEDAKSNPKLSRVSLLPYESFNSKVGVSLVRETHIMRITVSDIDPEVCMHVTNRIAGVFIDKVKKITKIDNIQVIDKAVKPMFPVKPNVKKNVMASFAFGFIGGLVIIFLIFFFDNTVKTPDDVIELFDLPVIGVINEFDVKVVGK